mgnify:CR=1 FL=1
MIYKIIVTETSDKMAGQVIKVVRYIDQATGETFEKKSYVDLQFTEIGYLFFQEDLKKVLPKCLIKKFVSQANEIQPHFEIIK